ncbi:MAG: GNAT family N-acetyltransferase [Bacteroidetes bacterium]|nr:GNAT family N-acetyltransferase [Bacteroidota bacterium]MBX7045048.1 GNAT family N-acetyltransferase [Ignavibacteria bacterium]
MTEQKEITELDEELLPEFIRLFHDYRISLGLHSVPIAEEKFLRKRFYDGDFHVILASVMFNSGIIEYTEYAGFAILYPFYSTIQLKKIWLLNDIFVEKKYRHQGIGTMLLETCINISEKTESCGIVLETLIESFGAKKLVEKRGLVKDNYTYAYYREHK